MVIFLKHAAQKAACGALYGLEQTSQADPYKATMWCITAL